MAASEAATEAIWIRGLMSDLGYQQDMPTRIHEDNHGAIKLSRNAYSHQRTKHVDVRYHFVRERTMSNEIELTACPTNDMAADMLTKAVTKEKMRRLGHMLGLVGSRGTLARPEGEHRRA